MAAYAFAKLDFKFKRTLFALMLVTIMLPAQVLIIPQYIVFHKVGWINTILPLVVPTFFAINGLYVFMMVQFIRGLPRELSEAAEVDGAGHPFIFLRIIVPLAAPAMATVALFSFVASWNEFLGPLLYLTSPNRFTVPLGLDNFINSGTSGGASAIGPLFAMCTLSLAPVIAVFLAAQRYLAEGISTSGLK
jgi:multiple sugar transport system permease protein